MLKGVLFALPDGSMYGTRGKATAFVLYTPTSFRNFTRFSKSIRSCLSYLYSHAISVVRTPDTSDTGVDTVDRLVDSLQLLSVGIAQKFSLLQNLDWLHIPNANSLLAAVDVVANNDGMFRRAGRHGELDLGVGGGELGKLRLDEATGW